MILVAMSCAKPLPTPKLANAWFANAESINYLNLQRMALDLRTDSTYRYYYRNAPIPPLEVGEDYTEGGRYRVRGDSLIFTVIEANGNRTMYDYARKYRLLPDTTAWPLRVMYKRNSIDFEVYFSTNE